MSMSDAKGMAIAPRQRQRRFRKSGQISVEVLFTEAGVVSKRMFTIKLAQVFIEDIADWARSLVSISILRRYAVNFSLRRKRGMFICKSFCGQESDE